MFQQSLDVFRFGAVSSTGVPKGTCTNGTDWFEFFQEQKVAGRSSKAASLEAWTWLSTCITTYYDLLWYVQSYKVTIFSAENAQMERLEDLAYEKQGEKRGKNIGTDMMFAECESKSTIRKLSDFAEEWKKPNMFNVTGSERNRRCQATGGLGPCCDLVVISCGCQLVACQTHKTERKCLWMCSASKYFT